jgi:hypothetical protein
MSRQTRFLREGVEDQLILEQAKGAEGMSREQIESRIVVPRHTIFLQIFPLYILPVIIIVAGYFFFSCSVFVRTKGGVWPPVPVLCRRTPARAGHSPDARHQTEWHG